MAAKFIIRGQILLINGRLIMIKQNSYTITKAEMANKKWYVVDATDLVVGRLASEVAKFSKANISLSTQLTTMLAIT